jgi:hypothetical protein
MSFYFLLNFRASSSNRQPAEARLITFFPTITSLSQLLSYISIGEETEKRKNLHNTSCAVIRFLGSLTSIFLTKSIALSDILGQGSDEKSRSPCKTSSNISCSVSISKRKRKRRKEKSKFELLELWKNIYESTNKKNK